MIGPTLGHFGRAPSQAQDLTIKIRNLPLKRLSRLKERLNRGGERGLPLKQLFCPPS